MDVPLRLRDRMLAVFIQGYENIPYLFHSAWNGSVDTILKTSRDLVLIIVEFDSQYNRPKDELIPRKKGEVFPCFVVGMFWNGSGCCFDVLALEVQQECLIHASEELSFRNNNAVFGIFGKSGSMRLQAKGLWNTCDNRPGQWLFFRSRKRCLCMYWIGEMSRRKVSITNPATAYLGL